MLILYVFLIYDPQTGGKTSRDTTRNQHMVTKMSYSVKNIILLQRKSKISASRKLMLKVRPPSKQSVSSFRQTVSQTLCVFFQSLMVAKAKEELEQEIEEKEEQKAKYLEEKSPHLQTSGMSLSELQVLFYVYGLYLQI